MKENVIVRSEGRIAIPKKIRDRLGIKKGSILQLETYPTGSENPNKILIEVIVR